MAFQKCCLLFGFMIAIQLGSVEKEMKPKWDLKRNSSHSKLCYLKKKNQRIFYGVLGLFSSKRAIQTFMTHCFAKQVSCHQDVYMPLLFIFPLVQLRKFQNIPNFASDAYKSLHNEWIRIYFWRAMASSLSFKVHQF